MPRKTANLTRNLPQKRNKLDWSSFNLLENLLIFCVVPNGNAPAESGVQFRINSPADDGVICVLFKIDRGSADPLIRGEEIKPDYMAFYADQKTCVCSIIEMKGITESGLEHGIDQIKKWRDILREEIKKHLPNKFRTRLKVQGILLSPPNSNIPLAKIRKEASSGLIILPLQYQYKAELFNYISKVHKNLGDRYVHESAPHDAGHGFLERVLVENAMDKRVEDNFWSANYSTSKKRDGVYINYRLSKDDYAVLALNNSRAEIALKESQDSYSNKIRSGLNKVGVRNERSISLKKIS